MKVVSMFVPCAVDLFLPEIAESTVTLLRRAGVDPVYHQGQTCCGQPAFNSGYRKEAKAAARHFIEIFGDDEVVVSPSGSCAGTVKFHYPELFKDEPEWFRRATELATRVYELSQYLVDVLKVEDFGAVFEGKVSFHESCHNLRRLGISDQPRKLLAAVRGAEVVPMNQEDFCCGFGGTFANNYADISESMVQDKVENFLNTGADVLLLSEPGCLLNINGYLSRMHPHKKARHLASFLAENMKERRP
jgi:L-lactate dehydrogenase complex protein LldE